MVEEIFTSLPNLYVAEAFPESLSFYFSLGDTKKTVICEGSGCTISDGRTVEAADCVCKTSPEFFARIWNEGYRPGMKDFLSGTIKSNNPNALQNFLKGFGKS